MSAVYCCSPIRERTSGERGEAEEENVKVW